VIAWVWIKLGPRQPSVPGKFALALLFAGLAFLLLVPAGSYAQGGTGLGLALVKHVLNRHGGRLTIESTLGAGASFTMHVPLTAEPSPISSENQIKSGI
jgi:signal transduction histidine kinase